MNGRMYDARLGRFLSPDNYVQAPYNTQSYNRYSYAFNNPLVYVDPDGELAWFIPLIIGAVINIASNLSHIASADNFWQGLGRAVGYAAIGAASGAIGGFAGQAIAGAVGTIGFFGGALTGAVAGFSGGFVSGAGNAWLGGANFEQGLTAGLRTGGMGAATGGLMGGISGGITARQHGGNFWSGKGAAFEEIALSGDITKLDKDLEYSNKFARDFSEEHFGKVKGLNKLYADGSVPSGGRYELQSGNRIYNVKSKHYVRAVTKYLGTGKGSDVYLSQSIFSSKEQLYLSMGHEYLHIAYNQAGIGHTKILNKVKHASIDKWQYQQSKLWNYSGTNHYLRQMNKFQIYYNSAYDYRKFGFFLLNITPW